MYLATINVPGYLPQDEELHVFDTPREAWEYLADQRQEHEDAMYEVEDDPMYSETYTELLAMMNLPVVGTVYGDTPGLRSEHDLGIAYSVEEYEGSE